MRDLRFGKGSMGGKVYKKQGRREMGQRKLRGLTIRDCSMKTGVISRYRFAIDCDSNVPGIRATIAYVGYRPHAKLIIRSINEFQNKNKKVAQK